MRKILALALALVFSAGAFAQTPGVTTTIDNLTPTTITASFDMDENCTKYHILADVVGGMDQWVQMFGMPLRDLVISWSIGVESDTTYTWTDMTPNTDYIVYVVAVNETDTSEVLMTTCTTPQNGGEGASVVTVEVSNITHNSAVVTVTPNDQTSRFLDGVVEKAYYEEIGQDSLMSLIMVQPYWLYETDVWEWLDLAEETEYYAFGIGQNAAEQWGEMAIVPFTTLVSGLNEAENGGITLYPNPATNLVSLNNAEMGSVVELIDIQGRVLKSLIVNSTSQTISLQGLESGLYLIKTTTSDNEKQFINKLIVNE
ncbi:MAG: T9SS type A sorting domain-containing protein [Bacteroidales bacterium]|nr:T9SS type A sorting domain-containing protein [Bacteroidales bacterium]